MNRKSPSIITRRDFIRKAACAAVGTAAMTSAIRDLRLMNAAVAQSKTRDLGVIQLTNHYETEIDLGTGKSCTITPRLLDRRELQLTLSFGTKNAAGRPTGLSVTRVTAQPDQPFDITVNDMALTFTPKVEE